MKLKVALPIMAVLILLLVNSCSSLQAKQGFFKRLGTKATKYKHKASRYQTWGKCSLKDLTWMPEKEIAQWQEYFCYRWCVRYGRINKHKCFEWQGKTYHVVRDHELFISRGIWTPTR